MTTTMTMSDHSSSEEDEDVDIHDADEPAYDSDDGVSFTEQTKAEHKPRTSQQAADAEFLDSMDLNQNVTSITDLHRSNLLRLQTQELVTACQLDLGVQEQHVQWADIAHTYVSSVTALIETIPATTITYSKKSPFALQSDKKDLDIQLGNSLGAGDAATATAAANSAIKTSSGLQVEATGCYQAGIGLTVPSGNANVLPTLDLVVKLPNSMFDAKDYLRHRYFDVRNK